MAEAALALIILAVERLERATSFYEAAFGWSRTVDTAVYVELAVPNRMRLGLYDRVAYSKNIGVAPPSAPTTVTATELYFYVDDVDAAVERAQRAGARLLGASAPRDWGDVVAYLADPDGNVLALAKRLA